jgi:hypothetical protein
MQAWWRSVVQRQKYKKMIAEYCEIKHKRTEMQKSRVCLDYYKGQVRFINIQNCILYEYSRDDVLTLNTLTLNFVQADIDSL